MRVQKVELLDFKRFDNLTIDLGEKPSKVIALVGPNGSGKSCIFDAFEEKIKDIRGGSNQPSFLLKSLYSSKEPQNTSYNRNNQVKITTVGGHEINKKSFNIRTPYRFTPKLNVTAISSLPNLLEDNTRPQSSIDLDQRLQSNYQRLIGRFVTQVYNKNITGKDWVNNNTRAINEILDRVLNIQISYLGDVTSGKGQLYFSKGASSDFPYENLSSGEKEVIELIVDLLIKIEEYDDTVWCIDEPELHLSTAIQKSLLIEIEKLIPDQSQLWIATHSIGFLRALQNELKDSSSIIDFSDNDFDQSVVLKPLKTTRNNWKRIFRTALEDITGLLSPERIIYCEGKKESISGEEQGMDALIYNKIFESEYPETLFISSGGETQPEDYSEVALAVLEKAFDNVSLYVLKDRDELTDIERNDWINASSRRKMLARREIENYLYDWEIISVAYPSVVESDYRKIVSDIEKENVKDITGDLMSLCNIHTGINSREFRIHLSEFVRNDTMMYKLLNESIFNDE